MWRVLSTIRRRFARSPRAERTTPPAAPSAGTNSYIRVRQPGPNDPIRIIDYPAGTEGFELRGYRVSLGDLNAFLAARASGSSRHVEGRAGSVGFAEIELAALWKISHVDGVHYVDCLGVILPLLEAGRGDEAIALMQRFVDATKQENRVVWRRSVKEAPVPYYTDLLDLTREAVKTGNMAFLRSLAARKAEGR